MFGWLKRRKHPLPRFPSTIKEIFETFCSTKIEGVEAEDLSALLSEYMKEIREKAENNPSLDLPLAEAIEDRLNFLIKNFDDYDQKQKSLIIGAVRYFAYASDPYSEEEFATGFFDDAKVLNYVLEELGHLDSCIDLR
ncbi:MAG: hypothetical protein D6780_06180 [Candidatus Dadabacteria bacterium]|nr:MAG: hypothetical protein D6780_06180 [Candidatus Dadabacteria bacterium]